MTLTFTELILVFVLLCTFVYIIHLKQTLSVYIKKERRDNQNIISQLVEISWHKRKSRSLAKELDSLRKNAQKVKEDPADWWKNPRSNISNRGNHGLN